MKKENKEVKQKVEPKTSFEKCKSDIEAFRTGLFIMGLVTLISVTLHFI